MGYAYQITAIAGMFSLIVFSHELGHFVMARAAGVKVKRFSIGFGPALYRKNVNETEFVIALIPLGGFVELLGEDPSENVSKEDVVHSFRHQPVSIRVFIVLAGAVFNITVRTTHTFSFSLYPTPGSFIKNLGRVASDSSFLRSWVIYTCRYC